MSGPAVVCIKRKRTEQAPDALLLDHSGKRKRDEFGNVHYVRQKDGGAASGLAEMKGRRCGSGGSVGFPGTNGAGSGVKQRRTFHLKRPAMLEPIGSKKQKRKHEGVATFIESIINQPTKVVRSIPDFKESSPSKPYAAPEAPLKRPGSKSALKVNGGGAFPTNARNVQVDHESTANSLHEFAQQVVATEAKPLTAKPKLPPQRSRELHRQSTLRNVTKNVVDQDGDADMEDDADYVYDTYILAPTSSDGAVQVNAYDTLGSVGFLVITEEDQDVWETYLEDEPSDKDWNSDEEDENAEDWYGADYPDEELASDDEFGCNNDHGYRARGAADDEEWDEDTGNLSDEEWGRQVHPWKKMSQLH